VRLDVDFEKIKTILRLIENCELSKREGVLVNLHPEFTIPEDQLHLDSVFPWLHDTVTIAAAQEERLPAGRTQERPKTFHEYRKLILSIQTTLDGWARIKKGWSLVRSGKNELAAIKLQEYKDHSFKKEPTLENILFHFCFVFLNPHPFNLFESAIDLCGKISRKNISEFLRFVSYYKERLKNDHMNRYFEIFSNYFKDFSEYNQTLQYQKYNLPLPNGHIASSNAFKRTKMFYGDAFEILTSNFTVLACLNNILSHRPFDQFQKMDLKKYLTINKAKRANPFKDTVEFEALAKCIDSTLRNASHHSSMKIDRNDIIAYQSGGTGALKNMSYSEYLEKCNEIMFSLAVLLMLELSIAFEPN